MHALPLSISLLVATVLLCPVRGNADTIPSMSNEQPAECWLDSEGNEWRVQCDPLTRSCIYAPNRELSSRGEPTKTLERVSRCVVFEKKFDRKKLEAEGWKIVPGKVDTPYGWTRDDRGRIFQTNFDLKRRMYFGTSYTPNKILGEIGQFERTSVDFGFLVLEARQDRNRHRLRLVEGNVKIEPASAELVLLHYDFSRHFLDPLFRVTTFVGKPKRHDIHLDLGLWAEAGHLEVHHTNVGDASLWRFGTTQLTVDLWQSETLDSFVRLRSGLGFERLYTQIDGDRSALTGSTALELDWVLDRKGFHNLRGQLTWEVPRYFRKLGSKSKMARRNQAKIEYEAIVLALNDQPISLTAGLGGERRNDLPVIKDTWAFVAKAGIRVSLWAPPKRR